MNRERSYRKETEPSLVEVEQSIEWYDHSIGEIKKQVWLWKKVSWLGKLTSSFFSKTVGWKERYLLPEISKAALFHIERMNQGDFRHHEEEKLLVLSTFLKKEAQKTPLVHSMTSPELIRFFQKEAPSFEKKKELFRKRCQKEGLLGESCVWYRNETFSQYVKRMDERLQASPIEGEVRAHKKSLSHAVPHTSLPEKKEPFMLSEEVRRLFFHLKEQLIKAFPKIDEMKKEAKLIKHRAFLFRAEDETIFQEVLGLEKQLLNISILFEEISSHIPENGISSLFANEKEAKAALCDYETTIGKEKNAIEKIQISLQEQEVKLSCVKKNVHNGLQALSKKISRVELLEPTNAFGAIQARLLSQARHAIDEYRKGMTKAPGLLFSMSRLEAYVEDIIALCLSFLRKGKSQEPFSRQLEEIENALSHMTVEGEEKKKKLQELSVAIQQVKGLYPSESEREKSMQRIFVLYEEMKGK